MKTQTSENELGKEVIQKPTAVIRTAINKAANLKTAIVKEVLPSEGIVKKKGPKKTKMEERESRLLNQMERKLATYQLSCTSVGKGFRKRDRSQQIRMPIKMKSQISSMRAAIEEDEEKHALAEHLRSIAPFNKRWQVTETINEGTYGVVFAVRDVETGVDGVIKVAKAVGNEACNQTAEWEGFVLEKIYKMNPGASIVRLLDKGMLADQNGDGMEFMVLEKAQFAVMDWLNKYQGLERKLAVTRAMLQMLKGIHDMHREGLLHRDLKPDNMGILSNNQPFVVLFDLGMTRMYTNQDGQCRTPRTTCPFRGTPEWASGWAQKGREQNRYDDLIAWMYVACELYDPATSATQPLPWTFRQSNRVLGYLKTIYCPAHILLRRAPRQFYEINTYLMTANRNVTPRYKFLADKVMEAVCELEALINEDEANNSKSTTMMAVGVPNKNLMPEDRTSINANDSAKKRTSGDESKSEKKQESKGSRTSKGPKKLEEKETAEKKAKTKSEKEEDKTKHKNTSGQISTGSKEIKKSATHSDTTDKMKTAKEQSEGKETTKLLTASEYVQ